MRSLYCHAWQSLVWNKAATRRVELYGAEQAVAGDLVLLPEGDGGEGEEVPAAAASGAGAAGEEEEEEEAPLPAGEDEAGLAAESEGGENARVHVVTESDVKAQRYSVTDVVLPVPGYVSVMPRHDVAAVYEVRGNARTLALDAVMPPSMPSLGAALT